SARGTVTGLAGLLMASPLGSSYSRVCMARGLNFSTGHRYGLPGDGASALAAKPQNSIGDFLWRHEAALRIVIGELSYRLLAATAGLFHDVIDTSGDEIGCGASRTHRIHGHT